MLDLDPTRAPVAPREAATLLLLRDAPAGVEVFCVVRHVKSGFLGGAVVFPGGKVDPTDRDAEWKERAVGVPRFAPDEDELVARAYGIAVCREALEEAAILLTTGAPLAHDEVLRLRHEMQSRPLTLREALHVRGLALDLGALHPFGRWVTPVAESRRFDTRFFLACAPPGQRGAHDAHETTASFWSSPKDVLGRFDRGEIQLAPPTHRSLELLSTVATAAEAVTLAKTLGVEPICPILVPLKDAAALVLPGDPAHEVEGLRVPGRTRFVLRGDRWVPEDA